MRKKKIAALSIIVVFFLSLAGLVLAHNPRIVSGETTTVNNPEVSQAFYGEMKGSADVFKLVATKPIDLYVRILVPDTADARKDMSAEVYTGENLPGQDKTGDGKMQVKNNIAFLNGNKYNWTKYYEPFTGDNYLQGPEFKSSKDGEKAKGMHLDPGTYFVRVFDEDNEGKYVLTIGTKESFSPKEILNAVETVPKINMQFFGKSPVRAFWNLTGFFVVLFVLVLVLAIRFWRKKRKNRKRIIKEKE